MRRFSLLMASVAVLTFTSAGAALAQTVPEAAPYMRALSTRVSPGATLENYLTALRREFQTLDADGDGVLSPGDADIHKAQAEAGQRAQSASNIMRADLDADGAVTEDELRRHLRYQRRSLASNLGTDPTVLAQQIEQEVRRTFAADADKDGRITYAEAADSWKGRSGYDPARMATDRLRQLLTLAAEKDERVTLAALEKAGEAFFRQVDSDGNGTISSDEYTQNQRRIASISQLETNPACAMPKPSEASKLVVLSAYQTEALSSVAIGFQDAETGAGNVRVEPGSEPLYLVIATHGSVIWQFTGAVERIERVVLTSMVTGPNRGAANEAPLAGVTGLPKDRVTFLQNPRCIEHFSDAPSTKSAAVIGTLRRTTGKEASVVAARYSVTGFAVPSGAIDALRPARSRGFVIINGGTRIIVDGDRHHTITEKGAALAERLLRDFTPGGVVTIDPASVVSSRPAEAYQVLPREAGLLQLVKSGALTINDSGEFVIRSKIRLPSGLHGAHSVTFLLLRGVPEPDGDPGHSSVISEETGLPIKGTRPRR